MTDLKPEEIYPSRYSMVSREHEGTFVHLIFLEGDSHIEIVKKRWPLNLSIDEARWVRDALTQFIGLASQRVKA